MEKQKLNDWDDVQDVLFDGTEDEIKATLSPKGNPISFIYNENTNSLEVKCEEENLIIRNTGCFEIPNCHKFGITETNK